METALEITSPRSLSVDFSDEEIRESFEHYDQAADAKNTRDTYRKQWQYFATFCAGRNLDPLPAAPNTVWLYLLHRLKVDKVKRNTIKTGIAAIKRAHLDANRPDPLSGSTPESQTLRKQIAGMMRDKAKTEKRRKAGALAANAFPQLMAQINTDTPEGLRDAALFSVAMQNACRRSEPLSLLIEDITWRTQRAEILLRKSKTDQLGEDDAYLVASYTGTAVDPYTALKTWVDWLKAQGIVSGAIFRRLVKSKGMIRPVNTGNPDRDAISGGWYNTRLKDYARAAGVEVVDGAMSSHTIRATFVDRMNSAGQSTLSIAKGGRWKSLETVRRYGRDDIAKRAVDQLAALT